MCAGWPPSLPPPSSAASCVQVHSHYGGPPCVWRACVRVERERDSDIVCTHIVVPINLSNGPEVGYGLLTRRPYSKNLKKTKRRAYANLSRASCTRPTVNNVGVPTYRRVLCGPEIKTRKSRALVLVVNSGAPVAGNDRQPRGFENMVRTANKPRENPRPVSRVRSRNTIYTGTTRRL